MNICEKIYNLSTEKPIYGDDEGMCRITGKQSTGIPFKKWVKKTFTDHNFLHHGNIISNEARFTFEERSNELKEMVGKEKPQRFRNYSHFINDGKWYAYTKGNKKEIFELLLSGCDEAILSESGQKHLVFKHREGYWQLENTHIWPNIPLLRKLNSIMEFLYRQKFAQKEIISGNYKQYKIMKLGHDTWKKAEDFLEVHRGSGIFDLSSFLIHKYDKN